MPTPRSLVVVGGPVLGRGITLYPGLSVHDVATGVCRIEHPLILRPRHVEKPLCCCCCSTPAGGTSDVLTEQDLLRHLVNRLLSLQGAMATASSVEATTARKSLASPTPWQEQSSGMVLAGIIADQLYLQGNSRLEQVSCAGCNYSSESSLPSMSDDPPSHSRSIIGTECEGECACIGEDEEYATPPEIGAVVFASVRGHIPPPEYVDDMQRLRRSHPKGWLPPNLDELGRDGFSDYELRGLSAHDLTFVLLALQERVAESKKLEAGLDKELQGLIAREVHDDPEGALGHSSQYDALISALAAQERKTKSLKLQLDATIAEGTSRTDEPVHQSEQIAGSGSLGTKATFANWKGPIEVADNASLPPMIELRGRLATIPGLEFVGVMQAFHNRAPLHLWLNMRDCAGVHWFLEGKAQPQKLPPEGLDAIQSVLLRGKQSFDGAQFSLDLSHVDVGSAVELLKSSDRLDGTFFWHPTGPNSSTFLALALARAHIDERSPYGALGWNYFEKRLSNPVWEDDWRDYVNKPTDKGDLPPYDPFPGPIGK